MICGRPTFHRTGAEHMEWVVHMECGCPHGLGLCTWIGTVHMEWDCAHALGSQPY